MTSRPPAMEVCGVRIDAYQVDSAVEQLLVWGAERVGRAVHLCNAYTLSLALEDVDFTNLLNADDANLPDGMPLIWIARQLGLTHMRERVYGPDLMHATLDRGRAAGARHYLYGSSPDVVRRLAERLRNRFHGLELAGVESPPYRNLSEAEADLLVERIAASDATHVWVGLGTPRQDDFVHRFRRRINAPLIAVGAAFDFHADAVRQAPRVVQRAGLEWLFRLSTEPRRLWRRYLFGNSRFIAAVVRERPRLID